MTSNTGAKSKMNKQTQTSKYYVSSLLKYIKTNSYSNEIYYKAMSSKVNAVIPLFVIKFEWLSSDKHPLFQLQMPELMNTGAWLDTNTHCLYIFFHEDTVF